MLVLLISLGSTAFATTYTVKAGGGGSYTTIQACETAAVAGDSCVVYAGTYNEYVGLSHASGTGTAGVCSSCITFTVNSGDTVNVYGFDVTSSYVIINGFYITDPALSHAAAGVYFESNAAGVQVTNNTITQVGEGYSCIRGNFDATDTYATFSGNTISWCSAVLGQGNGNVSSGIDAYGSHFLIQNNSISHTNNGIQVKGNDIVIRGNTYGPVNTAVDFPSCLGTGGCDTHVDYIEVTSPSSHILIEGNTEHDILGQGGAHSWIFQSASSYTIERFNTIYNIGSGYALINDGGPFTYVKDYNNTIVNDLTQVAETTIAGWTSGNDYGAFLNELMYNIPYVPGTPAFEYYYQSGTTGFVSGYNLAWDTSCSPETMANCTSLLMLTDTGNQYADPKFVNAAGNNYHLQFGSPAIAAGGALTAVAAGDTGSGTALIVNDASYFQDGLGVAGVNADWVRVGASTTAQISSINYSTNTITLASGISRSSGNPVYLYKNSTGAIVLNGSAPNIGMDQSLTGQFGCQASGFTASGVTMQ